jgi:hypothetical protein
MSVAMAKSGGYVYYFLESSLLGHSIELTVGLGY